ncbi:MAG TPA: type II toxin-antitoxin system VapC family toxin [Candidatus Bathyarchaeota archaeon]|nr:type II toxin-antitoxin system VapC family toxin [Candidatus Bathyarchaeota archaeon]
MIVVDTDVLIEIFDRKSVKGKEALNMILDSGEVACITAINLHEILFGLEKYAKPVKEVLRLPVLGYLKRDACVAAKMELEMERSGCAIRRTDAMIAAVTVNNGAVLFTFDLKHFKPLEKLGLKLFS